MTDNPGDDNNLDLDDGSFDNFEKKQGNATLGDLWRENALFKVGVVVAAAVAIFGTIIIFGSPTEKPDISMLPSPSEVVAAPGTEGATPEYIDAVKEENERRTETAQTTGGSSLPTPIEPPVGRLAIPEEEASNEDPLQRWRKLQEERLERELQRTQSLAPENVPMDQNRQEAIQQMAGLFSTQMQAILDSKGQVKVQHKMMTEINWLDELKKKEEEEREKLMEKQQQQAAAASSDEDPEVIILPAAEIAYAQLLIEANSDVPGPVMAQIAGGPLNGARILGEFEVTENDMLALTFDTIVLEGISYDVDAIALDPKTTLPALVSDVDHHYLKRIVLPMAASFVTGMAEAVSESGLTTVTIDSGGGSATGTTSSPDDKQEVAAGIDKAGQELETIFDEIKEDTPKVTVILKTGTPLGILFLEPVIQSNNNIKVKEDEQAATNAYLSGAGLTLPGSYATLPAQQSALAPLQAPTNSAAQITGAPAYGN